MEISICYFMIYVTEAVIAWSYCRQMFLPKRTNVIVVSCFCLGYLSLFSIIGLRNVVFNTVAFFVINGMIMYAGFHVSIQQTVIHSAFLTSSMIFTELFWIWSVNGIAAGWVNGNMQISAMIAGAIPSKLLYLMVTLVVAHWFPLEKESKENSKIIGSLLLLPSASIVISCVAANIAFHSEMSSAIFSFLFLTIFTLLLINSIYIVLYYQLQSINARKTEAQVLLEREQAEVAYYQILQEQAENQRIIIHDVRNHLLALHDIAQSEKDTMVTTYVEKLVGDIVSIRKARFCTDEILNLILSKADEQCQKKKIAFHCDIRESCMAVMDSPSITTLYSNLLSNAIEAAENSVERTIDIAVTKEAGKDRILISVVNSSDKPPVTNGKGELISGKVNKKLHGLGTKSINRIVKQYDGESTYYYDESNKRFHYIILLPDSRKGSHRV